VNLHLGCAARGSPRGGDTPGSSPRTRERWHSGWVKPKALWGAVAEKTDGPGASRGATRGGPLRTPPVGWDHAAALGGNGLRGAIGSGRPEPEVGEDLLDDLRLLDEGNSQTSNMEKANFCIAVPTSGWYHVNHEST